MKDFAQRKAIDLKYLVDGANFLISKLHFNPDGDYFITLGLPRHATQEEIRQRWKRLMLLYHPDRQQGDEEWLSETAKKVNEAYSVLKDEKRRAAYTHKLAAQAARGMRQETPRRVSVPPISRRRGYSVSSGWLKARRHIPKVLVASYVIVALVFLLLLYLQNRSRHLEEELTARTQPEVRRPFVPAEPERENPLRKGDDRSVERGAEDIPAEAIDNRILLERRGKENSQGNSQKIPEASEKHSPKEEQTEHRQKAAAGGKTVRSARSALMPLSQGADERAGLHMAGESRNGNSRKEGLLGGRNKMPETHVKHSSGKEHAAQPPKAMERGKNSGGEPLAKGADEQEKSNAIPAIPSSAVAPVIPKTEEPRAPGRPSEVPHVERPALQPQLPPAGGHFSREERLEPPAMRNVKKEGSAKTESLEKEITEGEVRQFMEQYARAYTRSDLDAFMSFFSRRVLENNSLNYHAIRKAYRETFSEKINHYRVQNMKVEISGPLATVWGTYHVDRFLSVEDRWVKYSGKITWRIAREDSDLRIISVSYDK